MDTETYIIVVGTYRIVHAKKTKKKKRKKHYYLSNKGESLFFNADDQHIMRDIMSVILILIFFLAKTKVLWVITDQPLRKCL